MRSKFAGSAFEEAMPIIHGRRIVPVMRVIWVTGGFQTQEQMSATLDHLLEERADLVGIGKKVSVQ